MSKVIHQSIRNNTQRNLVSYGSIYLHQTIYCIIQCRISTHNNDCLIAIIDKHLNQTLYTFLILALHEIIVHMKLAQNFLYPSPARTAPPSSSRTIEQSPFIFIYSHVDYSPIIIFSILIIMYIRSEIHLLLIQISINHINSY
ncbi:unknown [Prevotella sp. CAG:604]|nr:unknown [Prevotella sp. CAG:604]